MSVAITESDWKRFRDLAPELQERYLREKNGELTAILGNEEFSPTERFRHVEQRVHSEAKLLSCLDEHSPSRMTLFMALMYQCGVLRDADLECFREAIQEHIRKFSAI